ncbi:MAG: LptA/OstA family protein [Candidatus Muiribacteriota bacterium]
MNFFNMKTKKVKLCLICLFLIYIITYCQSEENKVVIYGGIVDYHTDNETIFVRDGAHIFYDEYEIFADNIQFDIENDKVFAVGNVIFWQGTDRTTGDYLEYSHKTGEGYIENGLLVRNESLIYAEKIHISVRKIEAEDVVWTTCDLDEPHYYMEAERIEVIPDRIIYAYNMRYRILDRTMFSGSQYKIDIRPEREDLEHKYGYSSSRGLWLKLTYNYLLRENSKGTITYDYSVKGSKTLSTSHDFNTGSDKSGKLNINTNHFQSADSSRKTDNIRIRKSDNFSKGSYRINTGLFSKKYEGSDNVMDLDYNASFSRRMDNNIFRLSDMNLYWNEKKRVDGPGEIRSFDKVPEITFSSQRFEVFNKNLRLNYNFLFGKYHEGGPDPVDATKREGRISYSTQSYDLPYIGTVNLSGSVDHSNDSKGNDKKEYQTGLTLNKNFGRNTRFSNRWDRRDVFGQSAFAHQTRDKSSRLRSNFNHNKNNFRLTLFSFNYDMINDVFLSNAYSDLRYSDNKIEYYMKVDYDLKKTTLNKLFSSPDYEINTFYNRLSYNFDDDNYLRLTFPYDYQQEEFTSMFAQMNFVMPDLEVADYFVELSKVEWNINWRKDFITNETRALNLEARIDLHCWEALIKWDRNRREGWLEFYVKAFSDRKHKIKYDSDEGTIKPVFNRIDTD